MNALPLTKDEFLERNYYDRWRHGGWYTSARYAAGGSGCVSRNYADKKWRIVCDKRFMAHDMHTYRTRDDAAYAEYRLTRDIASGHLCTSCGKYFQADSDYCGLCGHDLAEQRGKGR